MAQQILSTNTFTTAKWIVSSSSNVGTHTTIGGALTSASSGDTIFILPGTYTEDLTLKAGVNLAAYTCDAQTPNVIILGKATFTGAGTVSISGIQLKTNSDFFLAVTGSAASIVNLVECFLNVNNNTGISYSSSSGSSAIHIYRCTGDTGTTGIAYFSSSGGGRIDIMQSQLENHGNSTTSSTFSAGTFLMCSSRMTCAITSSSTGVLQFNNCQITPAAGTNQTMITHGGSASNSFAMNCQIGGGTSSAVSISSTFLMYTCVVDSSNTNCITGAGTLQYGGVSFSSSSSTINVTTQTPSAFSVPQGGTGDVSFTSYAVICGGTSSTAALQSVAALGASGTVLTSNGAGALPTFQAASGGTLLTATGSLTSAQIKALHATPIQAIAAPGSGKVINIVRTTCKMIYGGTNAFTNGQTLALNYNNGAGATGMVNFLQSTSITPTSSRYDLNFGDNIATIAIASLENQALVIYNPGTEITGNAAGNNSITWEISYYVTAI